MPRKRELNSDLQNDKTLSTMRTQVTGPYARRAMAKTSRVNMPYIQGIEKEIVSQKSKTTDHKTMLSLCNILRILTI